MTENELKPNKRVVLLDTQLSRGAQTALAGTRFILSFSFPLMFHQVLTRIVSSSCRLHSTCLATPSSSVQVFPHNCRKILGVESHWLSLGHMLTPEPVTESSEMECSNWTGLGHVASVEAGYGVSCTQAT